jgi:hypothetical protein
MIFLHQKMISAGALNRKEKGFPLRRKALFRWLPGEISAD